MTALFYSYTKKLAWGQNWITLHDHACLKVFFTAGIEKVSMHYFRELFFYLKKSQAKLKEFTQNVHIFRGALVQQSRVRLQIVRSVVRILHWPNVNFSGHKKWISEAPLYQGMNWYPERVVSVQVRYSCAPYVGCTQNWEWNSFPRETRTLVS